MTSRSSQSPRLRETGFNDTSQSWVRTVPCGFSMGNARRHLHAPAASRRPRTMRRVAGPTRGSRGARHPGHPDDGARGLQQRDGIAVLARHLRVHQDVLQLARPDTGQMDAIAGPARSHDQVGRQRVGIEDRLAVPAGQSRRIGRRRLGLRRGRDASDRRDAPPARPARWPGERRRAPVPANRAAGDRPPRTRPAPPGQRRRCRRPAVAPGRARARRGSPARSAAAPARARRARCGGPVPAAPPPRRRRGRRRAAGHRGGSRRRSSGSRPRRAAVPRGPPVRAPARD